MINRVAFTGADNSVKAQQLIDISGYYPQIEWGILLSDKKAGQPRYPDTEWQLSLAFSVAGVATEVQLAAHLCGNYAANLTEGVKDYWKELPLVVEACQRVQLNYKAQDDSQINYDNFVNNLQNLGEVEVIFPYTQNNLKLARRAQDRGVSTSILFDDSGGRGVVADDWPQALSDFKCGYAGGLGPDNIRRQTEKILLSAGERDTWLDMESNLRSHKSEFFEIKDVFDMDKVISSFQSIEPYVI